MYSAGTLPTLRAEGPTHPYTQGVQCGAVQRSQFLQKLRVPALVSACSVDSSEHWQNSKPGLVCGVHDWRMLGVNSVKGSFLRVPYQLRGNGWGLQGQQKDHQGGQC